MVDLKTAKKFQDFFNQDKDQYFIEAKVTTKIKTP